MPQLPARPDLGQLRRHAKELLRAAKAGEPDAHAQLATVATRPTLSAAQLAIARSYGFASWAKLKTEVDRRDILNRRDLPRLAALLAEQPEQARQSMRSWRDHPHGASPLGYIAMLRFDAARLGLTGPQSGSLAGTGAIARALIEAGAPVDGEAGDPETPLITAASYGDAEVAAVLIGAGADLEAVAAPHAGGVPGGTALRHAAVFGMTDVLDLLLAAGARIGSLSDAAAAGDLLGWLQPDTPLNERVRALVMAADHQRLTVIDQLLEAGTPIDAEDAHYRRQALRLAATNGRSASVAHLLRRGTNPHRRDPIEHRTALEWCRHARAQLGHRASPGHDQVEALLAAVTAPPA
ncbi:ankyrin repeat domain-containing protein [Nonomuraea sp. JJY05]|uniref:ankyrin repeat domain-containing protein n=1 Tax=Nonomuraea sp. JJY05 TaxID=3350255 RepID=UPI00373EC50E